MSKINTTLTFAVTIMLQPGQTVDAAKAALQTALERNGANSPIGPNVSIKLTKRETVYGNVH